MNHLLTTSALCLGLLSGSLSAQSTILRPSWAPGFEYTISHDNELTTSTELLGEKIEQEINLSRIVALTVTPEGEEGEKKIEVTTQSYRASISALGNDLSFDSEEDGDEANPLLLAVVGNLLAPFSIIVDANEQVVRIEGTEGGGKLSGVSTSIAAQQTRDIFATSLTQGFPLDPQTPGATWNLDKALPATKNGQANIDVKFKYAENQMVKGSESAKVTFSGSLEGSFASEEKKATDSVFDADYFGHILVDVENRTTQEASSTLKGTVTTGKVEVPLTLLTTSKLLSMKKSVTK